MFDVLLENLNKLLQLRPIISIFVLLILAVVLLYVSKRTEYNTRVITYGALAIAASFVLSYIKIYNFPNGGAITVASMLPLFVFAVIAGPRAGVLAGLCYGMLQFIQEPFFVHWTQFLLDYPLAFGALGLAGNFKKNIYLGSIIGGIARFGFHYISGIVFFASLAGDQNVLIYSFIYNISYILPDLVICLAILSIPNVKSAIQRVGSVSV